MWGWCNILVSLWIGGLRGYFGVRFGFVGFAFGFCGVGSFCVFWVWGWVVVVLA